MPRFFVTDGTLTPETAEVILTGEDARHISLSLRMAVGDEVTLSDGKCIPLGPKEFAVLSLLWRRRGEAVSREEISREIGESTANKVDVYVCMLRKKLEAEDLRYIKTVRGRGYCLI